MSFRVVVVPDVSKFWRRRRRLGPEISVSFFVSNYSGMSPSKFESAVRLLFSTVFRLIFSIYIPFLFDFDCLLCLYSLEDFGFRKEANFSSFGWSRKLFEIINLLVDFFEILVFPMFLYIYINFGRSFYLINYPCLWMLKALFFILFGYFLGAFSSFNIYFWCG